MPRASTLAPCRRLAPFALLACGERGRAAAAEARLLGVVADVGAVHPAAIALGAARAAHRDARRRAVGGGFELRGGDDEQRRQLVAVGGEAVGPGAAEAVEGVGEEGESEAQAPATLPSQLTVGSLRPPR